MLWSLKKLQKTVQNTKSVCVTHMDHYLNGHPSLVYALPHPAVKASKNVSCNVSPAPGSHNSWLIRKEFSKLIFLELCSLGFSSFIFPVFGLLCFFLYSCSPYNIIKPDVLPKSDNFAFFFPTVSSQNQMESVESRW